MSRLGRVRLRFTCFLSRVTYANNKYRATCSSNIPATTRVSTAHHKLRLFTPSPRVIRARWVALPVCDLRHTLSWDRSIPACPATKNRGPGSLARPHGNRTRSFAPQLPECIENGRADLVLYLQILEAPGTPAILPICIVDRKIKRKRNGRHRQAHSRFSFVCIFWH